MKSREKPFNGPESRVGQTSDPRPLQRQKLKEKMPVNCWLAQSGAEEGVVVQAERQAAAQLAHGQQARPCAVPGINAPCTVKPLVVSPVNVIDTGNVVSAYSCSHCP